MDRQAEAAEPRQALGGEGTTQFRPLPLSNPPLFCPGCQSGQGWEMAPPQLSKQPGLGRTQNQLRSMPCSCGTAIKQFPGKGATSVVWTLPPWPTLGSLGGVTECTELRVGQRHAQSALPTQLAPLPAYARPQPTLPCLLWG